jgi:hypothetical protein
MKSYRRRNTIEGQFAPRLIEMLRSPAFRILSRAARQVLARIEIELADHGGMDNGKLPVIFDDFEAYGVRRHSIAPAIRELAAVGFIEVMEHGRAGNAEWRRPSKYRITYRHADRAPPTHEWRRITEDDAIMIAKSARRPDSNSARKSTHNKPKKSAQKQKPSVQNGTATQCRNVTTNPGFHGDQTVTTSHGDETVTTIDTFGVVAGVAAANLSGQIPQPIGTAAVTLQPLDDPWADLDIPDWLRRSPAPNKLGNGSVRADSVLV